MSYFPAGPQLQEGAWHIKQRDPLSDTYKIAAKVHVRTAHGAQIESWFRVVSAPPASNFTQWSPSATSWELEYLGPSQNGYEAPWVAQPVGPGITFDHYLVTSSQIRSNVAG